MTYCLPSHTQSAPTHSLPLHALALLTVFGLYSLLSMPLAAQQAPVQAPPSDRNIGYTLSPKVEWFQGENNSGLQRDLLFGGEAGINLGRYLELSGEALYGPNFRTDFSQFDALVPPNRDVEVLRYGARVRTNLRTDGVIPFLSFGTGVFQVTPDGADASRTIYSSAEAGITYAFAGRYRVSFGGELLGYRNNPGTAFLPGDNVFTGESRVVNPSLNASVALFLGGRPLDEETAIDESFRQQFERGLSGLRWSVDPFVSRMEWNEALGMPKDQNMRGVNAGFEVGSTLSLHGFYARGAVGDDLFDDVAGSFERAQMYGGEVRARLLPQRRGTVSSISPFIVIGGGYFDVLSNYSDDLPENLSAPADRFFATTGLGVEIPLGDTFSLTGSARSVFMESQNPTGTADTEIYGSLMYSLGVSFGIGGRDRTRPARQAQERPTEQQRLEARLDSIEAAQASASPEQQDLEARINQLEERARALQEGEPAPAEERRSNISGQTITVPVPEVGSLYIRFGEGEPEIRRIDREEERRPDIAGRMDEEAIRDAVREALGARVEDRDRPLTDEDVEQTVQRTLRRLLDEDRTRRDTRTDDSRVAALQSEIDELRRELRRERGEDIRRPERTDVDPAIPGRPFYSSFLGRPLTNIVPVTGFRAGQGPTQYQVGLRGDYRRSPSSNFRFLPEVAVGTSPSTTSVGVIGNVAYTLAEGIAQEQTGLPLSPYVGAGVGLVSARALRLGFATNIFFGAEYPLGRGAAFAEYSTLNTFSVSRFMIGYRIPL